MLKFILFSLALMTGQVCADSYRIKPGDTLLFEVMEDPDMRRSVLVLPDGKVSLPLAGTLGAAGLTVPEVEALILEAIGPNYVTLPHLTVSVASLAQPKRQARARSTAAAPRAVSPKANTIAVFAMGELDRPGKIDVAPGTTLLQFLAQAGGFTRFAARKRVMLRRTDPASGGQTSYRLNAKKMMQGAGPAVVLQAGDLVVVPERKLFE